ncbi:hypothetical protein LP419_21215 [Massilia sp. H-1]|nr:hypothetical protein LP419_21215 [Massilia sp. H-1]
MANDYVAFRFRLARHGLRAFVASLKSAAEILLVIGANVLAKPVRPVRFSHHARRPAAPVPGAAAAVRTRC